MWRRQKQSIVRWQDGLSLSIHSRLRIEFGALLPKPSPKREPKDGTQDAGYDARKKYEQTVVIRQRGEK